MRKVKWGVLSTANIGIQKVLPAMQKGEFTTIEAIGSANREKAESAAKHLGIPKVYSSYEEVLSDPEIEAVYIPLPNNLHVDWTIKALEAGKHVLCEKPISMDLEEAIVLQQFAEKYPNLKIAEAFMYKFHPQWIKAKEIVDSGKLGEIKSIHSHFLYNNVNPDNIRNKKENGGGGLMDIGCYCISFARLIYNAEPDRVSAIMELDENFGTDKFASGFLDFGNKSSQFTCSTQMQNSQGITIFGTEGNLRIEIPVNIPPETPGKITITTKSGTEEILTEPADQYTLQGDAFSKVIIENTEPDYPLADAIANMRIIDAIKESAEKGSWVNIL